MNEILLPMIPFEPITFDAKRDEGITKDILIQDLKEKALHIYEAQRGRVPRTRADS